MEIRVNLDVMMARRKISGGELAERFGYKSADSAKVMKSRCMSKFEAAMKQIYNEMFNE